MDKQNEAYLYRATLVSNKKEQTIIIMNVKTYAQGKKTDVKDHISYPEMSRKHQSIEIENIYLARYLGAKQGLSEEWAQEISLA